MTHGTELAPLGRRLPIVPRDDQAGRSLVAVVAILAFLAALAAGLAALVAASSREWRGDLAREATIQVRPSPGRDLDADVGRAAAIARAAPGIRDARILPREDAERLLEPWLGKGLDLSDLPVPRLVILEIDPGRRPDLRALAGRLSAELPGAALDDHVLWLSRLARIAGLAVLVSLGMVVLVLAASAGAIAFAVRGAMAGHRDVVEVLHFVGADDRFVARAFARRFAWLGLAGGLIGAAAAGGLMGFATRLPALLGAGGQGSEVEAFFGSGGAGWWTYAAIALVPAANALVAGLVTAAYVKRFLKAAY